jgi:phage-related protein
MELMVKIGGDTSGLDKALGSVSGKVASAGKSILGGIAKVSAVAIGAAAVGIGALTKQAVGAYKDYEQLVGGVETLFAGATEDVFKNAKQAYKTAGMSMNEYMETANGMAASLKQSLGGSTVEAAKYADMAIQDMADNANKMGTTMESIQNAYAGFSKQNYTMLDNLKLGYGGTKAEMERLLKDAEAIKKKNGEIVDYSIDSYADIVDAIHVVQEETGITGTTAKEAATTIEGSLASVKASWENILTTIASGNDKDLGNAIDGLVTALVGDKEGEGLIANLTPAITNAIKGIGKIISKAAPIISQELPGLMREILPPLTEALVMLIETAIPVLAEMLPQLIQTLLPALITAFTTLVKALIEHWPEIWAGLKDAFKTLVVEITGALDDAFPGLGTMILEILEALKEWAPVLETLIGLWIAFKAAMKINDVVNGIINGFDKMGATFTMIGTKLSAFGAWVTGTAIPAIGSFLAAAAPVIAVIAAIAAAIAVVILVIKNWGKISEWLKGVWEGIKEFFTAFGDMLVEGWAAIMGEIKAVAESIWEAIRDFFVGIWEAIASFASEVWNGIAETATAIWDGIVSFFTGILEAIANFFTTIWEGIKGAIEGIWNTISGLAETIWNGIKDTITGVIDALGTWLSTTWDNIKTTISGIWEGICTLASTWWSNICNAITDLIDGVKESIAKKWEEIKDNVKKAWEKIKETISGMWQAFWDTAKEIGEAVKEGIMYILDHAAEWGADFVQNFVNGILGNLFLVSDATNQIASIAEAKVGHSHPTEGPMADDYKWMPDMIDLFVKGINDNLGKVEEASNDLAYAIAPDISDVTAGAFDTSTTKATGDSGTTQGWRDIIIPMYLDGEVIDERVIKAEQIHNYLSGGR